MLKHGISIGILYFITFTVFGLPNANFLPSFKILSVIFHGLFVHLEVDNPDFHGFEAAIGIKFNGRSSVFLIDRHIFQVFEQFCALCPTNFTFFLTRNVGLNYFGGWPLLLLVHFLGARWLLFLLL